MFTCTVSYRRSGTAMHHFLNKRVASASPEPFPSSVNLCESQDIRVPTQPVGPTPHTSYLLTSHLDLTLEVAFEAFIQSSEFLCCATKLIRCPSPSANMSYSCSHACSQLADRTIWPLQPARTRNPVSIRLDVTLRSRYSPW